MSKLKDKYDGKTLSTDEVAVARTEIRAAISELEDIDYTTGKDSLLLKWGTLKGYNLNSKKAITLSEEYNKLGSSMSVIAQNDKPRQKEIILQIIDEIDGVIQNDWDGNYYTKQQAKDYILEYGDES